MNPANEQVLQEIMGVLLGLACLVLGPGSKIETYSHLLGPSLSLVFLNSFPFFSFLHDITFLKDSVTFIFSSALHCV